MRKGKSVQYELNAETISGLIKARDAQAWVAAEKRRLAFDGAVNAAVRAQIHKGSEKAQEYLLQNPDTDIYIFVSNFPWELFTKMSPSSLEELRENDIKIYANNNRAETAQISIVYHCKCKEEKNE